MAARAKNRKILKYKLLLYPLADFIHASYECCLGDPESKQLKLFGSDEQNDHHS